MKRLHLIFSLLLLFPSIVLAQISASPGGTSYTPNGGSPGGVAGGGLGGTYPNPTVTGTGLDQALGTPTTTGGQFINRTATGTYIAQPSYQVLSSCKLLDYDPSFLTKTEAQQGASYQNFLLDCQKKALTAGVGGFANLQLSSCYEATDTGGKFQLNTPIVIPRYICWNPRILFSRDGSSGSIASNWTGDPSTKALANLEEPNFILPPTGHITGELHTNLNQVGTDRGSGPFYGRTWRVKTLTINAGGTGFVGGETCTMANGDAKAPAAGAAFVVATASGGAATALTFAPTRWQSIGGQYYLPPFLQAQQWAVSNGWNGSATDFPTVFDGSGNYVTTCSGAGAGLTVTPTWWPDWCDGTNGCSSSTTYDGDFGNLASSTGYIHHIYASQSGNVNDATYGPTRAFAAAAFDLDIDEVQTQGSRIGQQYLGADLRVHGVLNDVTSAIQLKLSGLSSSHINNAVLDTPADSVGNDAHAMEIDRCGGCSITHFRAFHNSSSAATVGTNQIRLGSDANFGSSILENTELYLNGSLTSAGTSGSALTALSCEFTRNSNINLTVANLDRAGSATAQQFSKFAAFPGTNCEVSNVLSGSIDNVSAASLYTGTVPALRGYVFNGALNSNAFLGNISTGSAITTATQVTGFGSGSCDRVTTGTSTTCLGVNAGHIATTTQSSTFVGRGAGSGVGTLTGNNNFCDGANTCGALTGAAQQNHISGTGAGPTCSTGSNDFIIGHSSATDCLSSSSANEVNIDGLLFYNNNSLAAPVVTACGTNTIDTHANNRSGTVNISGGTPASCTITFAGTGYSTWNHCRVTANSTTATFQYSYTLTVLTLTATAMAGKYDYDCDGY